MKSRIILYLAGLTSLYIAAPAGTQSLLGYQGVIKVPSAFTTPDGEVVLGYGQVPGSTSLFQDSGRENQLIIADIGFLPFLEVYAGIVRYDIERMGIGDRTAAFRFRLVKEKTYHPQLSFGAHDPFGMVAQEHSQFMNTTYFVASKSFSAPLKSQLFLHIGHANDWFDSDQYLLLGWFYAAELQFYEHISLLGEYDTQHYNYGVRFHYKPVSALLTWLDGGQASWQVAYRLELK